MTSIVAAWLYSHTSRGTAVRTKKKVVFSFSLSTSSALNQIFAEGERVLSVLIEPDGHGLLCLSSNLCAWEAMWFLLNRKPRRAFRRFSRGGCVARLGQSSVNVWYPDIGDIQRAFFRFANAIDEMVREMPLLRSIGDHIVLEFCRSAS